MCGMSVGGKERGSRYILVPISISLFIIARKIELDWYDSISGMDVKHIGRGEKYVGLFFKYIHIYFILHDV